MKNVTIYGLIYICLLQLDDEYLSNLKEQIDTLHLFNEICCMSFRLKIILLFKQSRYWNDKKQFDQELDLLNQVISLAPQFAPAYNNRANYFRTVTHDYEKALEDYNKANEMIVENLYLRNRGNLFYENIKDYNAALRDFNHALELDPQDLRTLSARCNLYENVLHKSKEALSDICKCIAMDPTGDNGWFYNERANIYENQHKYKEALEDYAKAIEINPKEDGFYANRASFYLYSMKQFEKAQQDIDRAIALNPLSDDLYIWKALIFEKQGNKEVALEFYNMAIQMKPQYHDHYFRRGYLYSNAFKNQIAALKDYTKCLQLSKNKNATALNNKASIVLNLLHDLRSCYVDFLASMNIEFEFYKFRNVTRLFRKEYLNEEYLFVKNMLRLQEEIDVYAYKDIYVTVSVLASPSNCNVKFFDQDLDTALQMIQDLEAEDA